MVDRNVFEKKLNESITVRTDRIASFAAIAAPSPSTSPRTNVASRCAAKKVYCCHIRRLILVS